MLGEEFRRRFTDSERSRNQLLAEVLAVLCKKAKVLGRRLSVTDDADQEDVVHAVMEKQLERDFSSLRADQDVYAYLYRSMENKFLDLLRSRKSHISLEGLVDGCIDADRGAFDRLSEKNEELRSDLALSIDLTCLGKAYAALAAEPVRPGKVRTVDALDFLALADPYPTSEDLAIFFGTTEGAARERKSQALKRLRQKCQELCGDDTCSE